MFGYLVLVGTDNYTKNKKLSRGTIMTIENDITNQNELEFAIFCIENIAIKLGIKANSVYKALTDKSNILDSYIIPEYEVLHTKSKDYIVDDIISLMIEKGVLN